MIGVVGVIRKGFTHAHLLTGLPTRFLKPDLVIIDEQIVQSTLRWTGRERVGVQELHTLAGLLPEVWPNEISGDFLEIGIGEYPSRCAVLIRALGDKLHDLEAQKSPGGTKRYTEMTVGAEVVRDLDGGDLRELVEAAANEIAEADAAKEAKKRGPCVDPLLWKVPAPFQDPGVKNIEILGGDGDLVPLTGKDDDESVSESGRWGAETIAVNIVRPLVEALVDCYAALDGAADGTPPVAIPFSLCRGRDEAEGAWLSLRELADIPIPDGTRVIGLDATGNIDLFRKVLGRPDVEQRDAHVPTPGAVKQVQDVKLPLVTLSSQRSGERWRHVVLGLVREVLSEKGGPVFVACPARVEADLWKALNAQGLVGKKGTPDAVELRHFGGLRGESLERCKGAIILGFPQAPRDSVWLDGAALHRGKVLSNTWEPAWTPYKTEDAVEGQAFGLEVEMPTDPTLRALWKLSSLDELYQALHRVRPVLDRKPIYLLTNIPLDPATSTTVELIDSWTLEEGAGEARTGSEAVELLAPRVWKKLGWCSLRLLQAVFSKDLGFLDYSDMVPKELRNVGSLSTVSEKYPPHLRIALQLFESVEKTLGGRQVERAWRSYVAQEGIEPSSVVVRRVGRRGRPPVDNVLGDVALWALDHRHVIEDDRFVVSSGGDDVTAEDLDHVVAHVHPWNGGTRRIPLDTWGKEGEEGPPPASLFRPGTREEPFSIIDLFEIDIGP